MLIIAHRLTTIKNCDVILVMDNGKIVEQGSHEELLKKQGNYYKLWNMQQGNFVINDEKETEDADMITADEYDDKDTLSYT